MRKLFVCGILLLLTYNLASAVSFSVVVIDSGLSYPHGDWSGDVNKDNPPYALDVFATIVNSNQVVWYHNNNLGIAWSAKNVINTLSGWYCTEVAAADLDGDTWIDAVSSYCRQTAGGAQARIAFHKNNGNGTFTTTFHSDTVKARLRQMRLVDVNGDGLKDVIVAGSAPNPSYIQESGAYWYRNNGGMSFTKNFIATCDAWKCDAYDDEPDNHLEIVITEEFFGVNGTSPARLLLFKNNGSEVFTQIVIDPDLGLHLADPPGGGGVRCAKVDNDTRTDLIAGSSYNGVLAWYKNMGGNSFTKNIIDNAGIDSVDGVDICDFEPDGDLDIASCVRNYQLNWYENDGNGNFTKHPIDVQWKLFDLPFATYLDGDTCCDILVTEASPYPSGSPTGHVLAYLNDCDGSKVEEAQFSLNKNWLKTPSIIGKNSGEIIFGIEKSGNIALTAVDITGRIADVIIENAYYKAGTYNALWNVKGKSNGAYILLLKSENSPDIAKKVTVIR